MKKKLYIPTSIERYLADICLTCVGYMSDICPGIYVGHISFLGFHLWGILCLTCIFVKLGPAELWAVDTWELGRRVVVEVGQLFNKTYFKEFIRKQKKQREKSFPMKV